MNYELNILMNGIVQKLEDAAGTYANTNTRQAIRAVIQAISEQMDDMKRKNS